MAGAVYLISGGEEIEMKAAPDRALWQVVQSGGRIVDLVPTYISSFIS